MTEIEKPARKTVRRTYDWDTLRDAYVRGIQDEEEEGLVTWPTYDDLAKRYSLVAARIRERGAKERWADLRVIAQKEMRDERMRSRNKELAGAAIQLDEKALNVSKVGLNLVLSRLAEVGQEMVAQQERKRKLIEEGFAMDATSMRPAVRHTEMLQLSQAASVFHEMGRKALGEDIIRHELSGPGGTDLPAAGETTINVYTEMTRDDPDRLTKVVRALAQAGAIPNLQGTEDFLYEDAEIVGEDDTNTPAIEGETA